MVSVLFYHLLFFQQTIINSMLDCTYKVGNRYETNR